MTPMRLVVVVCFQDERDVLGVLLDSVHAQERRADLVVLVDDGSTDGSAAIAERWADAHDAAGRLVSRPPRPATRDRLGAAMELVAFASVVDEELAGDPWDVVLKLDADLQLPAGFFAALVGAFAAEPALGMAGAHLSERAGPAGAPRRMSSRDEHVHGATKGYRRACWEQIAPLPPIPGWDTIDEVRARR